MSPIVATACLCALLLQGLPALGQRDPFLPPVAGAAAGGPLQRIALDQLKLAAVLSGGDVARALLQDDAGSGYIVVVGSVVGAAHGVVTSIEPARIVVEERTRRVVLDLNPPAAPASDKVRR